MLMREHLQFILANHKQCIVDRKTTVEVQSPEANKIRVLEKILTHASKIGHDLSESCGALLLHNLGYNVNVAEGSSNNFKILRQEDIAIFSALLQRYSF